MHKKDVKDVLKIIKESNIVMIKDTAHLINKDRRYTQGFLDALEGTGLIRLESKATMKIAKLTDKGIIFLEEKE